MTSLNKSIFQIVSDMDLFAPKADQNNYGARTKKDLKVGNIGSNSYVPSGMTAEQYNKIRAAEKSKKDANYAKNVAKAGVFKDYTDFYIKRGTFKGNCSRQRLCYTCNCCCCKRHRFKLGKRLAFRTRELRRVFWRSDNPHGAGRCWHCGE